jgi:hypothetical protein
MSEMSEAAAKLKAHFAEDKQVTVDECLARWSGFLTQVEQAVDNYNEDLARKAA